MVAMGKDLKAESRHFRCSLIWLLTPLFCRPAASKSPPQAMAFLCLAMSQDDTQLPMSVPHDFPNTLAQLFSVEACGAIVH